MPISGFRLKADILARQFGLIILGLSGALLSPTGVAGNFMNLQRFCVVAAMVAALTACGTPNPNQRPAKSPDTVIITEEDITNRPYEVLSDIDVTVAKPHLFADDPTREMVAEALKKKAAEMGADAVVLVRYGTLGMGVFNWGQLEGRGRAVVFKQ